MDLFDELSLGVHKILNFLRLKLLKLGLTTWKALCIRPGYYYKNKKLFFFKCRLFTTVCKPQPGSPEFRNVSKFENTNSEANLEHLRMWKLDCGTSNPDVSQIYPFFRPNPHASLRFECSDK